MCDFDLIMIEKGIGKPQDPSCPCIAMSPILMFTTSRGRSAARKRGFTSDVNSEKTEPKSSDVDIFSATLFVIHITTSELKKGQGGSLSLGLSATAMLGTQGKP